jgi:hypothetical protein
MTKHYSVLPKAMQQNLYAWLYRRHMVSNIHIVNLCWHSAGPYLPWRWLQNVSPKPTNALHESRKSEEWSNKTVNIFGFLGATIVLEAETQIWYTNTVYQHRPMDCWLVSHKAIMMTHRTCDCTVCATQCHSKPPVHIAEASHVLCPHLPTPWPSKAGL